MIYSQLMANVYGDPESEFASIVASKIDEARTNGTASFSNSEFDLVFAEVDNDVVIEDKKNNEVTTATTDGDGNTKLECDQTRSQSATEPDVNSPRSKGEDGKGVEAPDSTLPDVDSPISVGITDPDKAGANKHYSLSFNGFESEDDATDFLNRIYTFSDEELEDVAFSANDTEQLAAKVIAYSDIDDAIELFNQADYIRCYANMAEYAGHDVDELLDRCDYYSNVASQVIGEAEMNTSVTEYFSDMTEDEIAEFFSELDDDVADVLFSAIEAEENGEIVTFSDVNDVLMENNELDQDITTLFSDMTDDEINEFFSNLTDAESIIIENAIESDDIVTFSDVNNELALLNEPIDYIFSDYSESDIEEYLGMFSDGELDVIQSLFSESEEGQVTYSDYLTALDDYQTQQLIFSDDEVHELAEDATELKNSAEELEKNPKDTELAKKVKALAEATLEASDLAESVGHDVESVKAMSEECYKAAAEILDKTGELPKSSNEVTNVVDPKDLNDEVKRQEKSYSDPSNPGLRYDKPKIYKTKPEDYSSESRIFSKSTNADKATTSNPCLTSKF